MPVFTSYPYSNHIRPSSLLKFSTVCFNPIIIPSTYRQQCKFCLRLTMGSDLPDQYIWVGMKRLCVSWYSSFLLCLSCCERHLHKLYFLRSFFKTLLQLWCLQKKSIQFSQFSYNYVGCYYNWPDKWGVLLCFFMPSICIHHGLC